MPFHLPFQNAYPCPSVLHIQRDTDMPLCQESSVVLLILIELVLRPPPSSRTATAPIIQAWLACNPTATASDRPEPTCTCHRVTVPSLSARARAYQCCTDTCIIQSMLLCKKRFDWKLQMFSWCVQEQWAQRHLGLWRQAVSSVSLFDFVGIMFPAQINFCFYR